MSRVMKRLLSLLLVLTMVVGILPIHTYSEDRGIPDAQPENAVSETEITVLGEPWIYDGSPKTPEIRVYDREVLIPEEEYSIGYSNNIGVGTATITLTDVPGNYVISGSAEFTISPRQITVKADETTKAYGSDDPVFTATVTGMAEGDSPELLSYSFSREPGETVGDYTVTPFGGAVQGNYSVAYLSGTLTVTPKTEEVVVTVTGRKDTVIYDGAEHSVSGYDVSIDNPLYSEEYFSFGGTAAAARTDAGTVNMGLDASQFTNTDENYANVVFLVTDGSQTVTPKPITVAANNGSKVYGSADPALTATVTGLVDGDELDYSLPRATGEDVGEYEITVTLGENPNYDVTATNGTFAITRKTATITADPQTKVYGSADPALTATVTGLVGNDTLNYSLSRAAGENVGEYEISAKSENNPNYDIRCVDAALTITRASVTVSAENKTKDYGAPPSGALPAGSVHPSVNESCCFREVRV